MAILFNGLIETNSNATVQKFRDFINSNLDIDVSEVAYLDIGSDDENIWYLAMGYEDGFEDGYELCAVIGYASYQTMIMDIEDFTMPYDEETGDVWDITLSNPRNSDADWLYKEFMDMVEESRNSVLPTFTAYYNGSILEVNSDLDQVISDLKGEIDNCSWEGQYVDLGECYVENDITGEIEYAADGDIDFANL